MTDDLRNLPTLAFAYQVAPEDRDFVLWRAGAGSRVPPVVQSFLGAYGGSRLTENSCVGLPDGTETTGISAARLSDVVTPLDGLPQEYARVFVDGMGNWFCVVCGGVDSGTIWFFDHDTAKLARVADSLGTFLGSIRLEEIAPQVALESLRAGIAMNEVKARFKPTGALARDAIDAQRLDVLEWLLDVGIRRPNLLHLAGKWVPALELMLSRGSDVDSRDEDGTTPLMYAVRAGRVESVKVLLENGATVSLANNAGRTATWFVRKPIMHSLLNPDG